MSKQERNRALKYMLKDKLAKIEATAPSIVHDRLANVGVCSFSEISDDILMWSHYADAHRGICLRFSPTRFDWKELLVFPVEYSADRPILHLANQDMQEWARVSLLTKAEHWSYEMEWRTIDVDGRGFHAFRPSILDAVILGAKMSPEHRELAIGWAKRRSGNTRIKQARFDERQFRIIVEDVEVQK
jgi:hypothetical protein